MLLVGFPIASAATQSHAHAKHALAVPDISSHGMQCNAKLAKLANALPPGGAAQ